jgi:hypothetical protein
MIENAQYVSEKRERAVHFYYKMGDNSSGR